MSTFDLETAKAGANALAKNDTLLRASTEADSIGADFRITNADDNDLATASRKRIKDGLATIDFGLKELFKPFEEAKKVAKAFFDPMRDRLTMAANRIDAQKLAFDRAERQRAEAEAQRQRDEEAKAAAAAAQAAVTAADEGDDEMPPPGAAEVYVAPVTVPAVSKMGDAKSSVKWTPVKCELAPGDRNAAIREVAAKWPHLLDLNEMKAKAEFNAIVARGDLEPPSEAGTVIGGVRFWRDRTVSGGRA